MISIQNLSIRKRLMTILAVWIIIFLGLGIYVLRQMSNLGSITRDIYDQPMLVSNAAIEVRVDMLKIQRSMRDMLLVKSVEEQQKNLELQDSLQKSIMDNLDIIKKQTDIDRVLEMEEETRKTLQQWAEDRTNVVELMEKGNNELASDIVLNKLVTYVNNCENLMVEINNVEVNRASNLLIAAKEIEASQRNALIIVIGLSSLIMFMVFVGVINSILKPITKLKNAMNNNINTGKLFMVDIDGENEIADMSRYYNVMIDKLIKLFWLKDSESLLNQELTGYITIDELSQRIINFLCRKLHAGKGVFYIYDIDRNVLKLKSAFAFTKQDKLSEELSMGEGIVGQVALERKAILLNNISREQEVISTAIISEAPLNAYAFPLIHEGVFYGVIEIASLKLFNNEQLEFLNESSENIAISLYSAIQNERIKNLLKESEEAREAANEKSEEINKANVIMQHQQMVLQQQTEELQQTNAELEEQQQLLQQQAVELQQTNNILEEQQSQLEEQTRLLDIQNRRLEVSKSEISKRSEELEVINKYKSEFLANMSHELRTPLNAIILLSKLLHEKGIEKLKLKDLEKIKFINESGQELLRLINDVLDLSKIESGMVIIEKQSFHSSRLTNEIRDMFDSLAKEKGLELHIKDNVNRQLYGDEYKISQILRNLVSNAVKFTHKGSVTLIMECCAKSKNGITFTVKDTGIGIPKDKVHIVFEKFKQVDGSISRKYGGTGLGLSICKKLSELMNGNLKFSSAPNIGSVFVLEIPNLVKEVNEPMLGFGNAEAEAACTREIESLTNSDNYILVIEDDSNFSAYIKEMIQGLGFITLIAENGRTGLELAARFRPKGILLDLGLPDINGMDVLRELKSTIELRNIPVQIISVSDKNNKPERAGAIGYSQKPIEGKQIIKLVKDMISLTEKKAKKLLLVEDDKIQAQAINELLMYDNILIKTVETEEAAKQEIIHCSYDTIILDLKLKEGAGQNVCKFIGERKLKIPVIIYTGKELTLEEEKNIRKYADSVIIKSANSQERLLDEVALFLHKVIKSDGINSDTISSLNEQYNLNLDGKTILIVDDDPRNVYTLASALEACNAEIVEADNGKTAMDRLKKEKIDLILIDIMMPEMDGYETIKVLRRSEAFKKIPIIAVTAKSLKEDKEKCISAGADDYICKPVDYNNLIRLVKAWITKER